MTCWVVVVATGIYRCSSHGSWYRCIIEPLARSKVERSCQTIFHITHASHALAACINLTEKARCFGIMRDSSILLCGRDGRSSLPHHRLVRPHWTTPTGNNIMMPNRRFGKSSTMPFFRTLCAVSSDADIIRSAHNVPHHGVTIIEAHIFNNHILS
jgi:hypothetical protein